MPRRSRSATVMVGGTVCRVEASQISGFPVGDIVEAYTGWQEYALSDGRGVRKLDPTIAPITTALGVLGMPGMTAWTGLMNIGQPKAGETLVVAAASGAVGSVVGQLAKVKGCRAVGIAGGEQQMPLRRRRARVRRLHRPPPQRFRRGAQGRLPQGDRHLLRKRRRCRLRCRPSAPQHVRAGARLRAHRSLQCDRTPAASIGSRCSCVRC